MSIPEPNSMSPVERRAAFSIAGIFSTRMLGLFMIFPVFALFAEQEFQNITGTQIGIAIGIYGLTQALLQIPFGTLSDKFGRKPLIIVGMLIFMLGSVICALADSIEMMILGRALQGMGAVAAVLMASVADLVREQYRLRAMSIVGMTIGLSFTLSLVAGPLLSAWIGVRGIFWVIALLSLIGILLVIFALPKIENQAFQREAQTDMSQFSDILRHGQLLRLDLGVFVLHAILTAMFVVMPLTLRDSAGLQAVDHWHIYLPVMLLSFVLMVPFIIQAESKGRMKQVFVGAIAAITLMQLSFIGFEQSFWMLFVLLLIFFTAFNLLEASLPSLVVKLSPADKKGTASGVYSTSQFIGAAIGGALGGYFYQHYGYNGVFVLTSVLGMIWLLAAMTMEKPMPLSIASVPLGRVDESDVAGLEKALAAYDGIYEVVIRPDEQRAYFKIDRKQLNEVTLIEYIEQSSESLRNRESKELCEA
ncbi:MFS transporter [Thiomicrorhabdus xiamenensis]|uniref:MFS transporter n=1 Tax=Thiomicrorhabdus xiamenensis TaxID=2739063 RepID=A0A7D4SIC8_9GAMM|nr:MFS transporter [Thiomicrorhabdus xiamenensis]QKI88459.1 MFS transporter [Thiomicrorhabdus xiamenensis]